MTLPRLYLPVPLRPGQRLSLPDAQRHHLVTVLRVRAGQQVVLFDGETDQEAIATLQQADRRRAELTVERLVAVRRESPLAVTVAQAVSSGERMDFTLQKGVELGAAAFQPLYSERSQRPLRGERLARRLRHWQGVIVHACEQSGRTRLPRLLSPRPLAEFLAEPGDDLRLLLDPTASQPLTALRPTPAQAITLIVGAEGGFSAAELALAERHGVSRRRLGPRILRTETAGLVALGWLQASGGDLGAVETTPP